MEVNWATIIVQKAIEGRFSMLSLNDTLAKRPDRSPAREVSFSSGEENPGKSSIHPLFDAGYLDKVRIYRWGATN